MENALTEDLLRGTVLDKFIDKPSFVPRKVKVKIVRHDGGWLPPEHEAAEMMRDSKRIYVTPGSASKGALVNPLLGLTAEQLDLVARKMGLEGREDLNVNKRENNFWNRFEVVLTRDGAFYDLSDVVQFLKWAVLRSDIDKIAPSWNERFDRGTYEFALVEEGEEDNQKLSRGEKQKEAWRLCGKLEATEAGMRDFLWVYYLNYKDAQKPPKQATQEFLRTQVYDIVENFTDRFLELASDPDYQTKLLVQKALSVKAVALRKGKYYIGDSTDAVGNLNELVEFLDDDRNQEDRLKIMQLTQNE